MIKFKQSDEDNLILVLSSNHHDYEHKYHPHHFVRSGEEMIFLIHQTPHPIDRKVRPTDVFFAEVRVYNAEADFFFVEYSKIISDSNLSNSNLLLGVYINIIIQIKMLYEVER